MPKKRAPALPERAGSSSPSSTDWAWLRSPLARFNLLAILAYGLLSILLIQRVQNDQPFRDILLFWYVFWEGVLFVFFIYNYRHTGHPWRLKSILWFSFLQIFWFGAGLALFGFYFADRAEAIHGVLGWVLGNYLLAAFSQEHHETAPEALNENYFKAIYRRKMPD